MNSSWTNKRTIIRDLYRAQGYNVPVEIDNAVSADERPPTLILKEETEESFYANCVGDIDTNTGPDLELIQQMLHAMRQNSEDENVDGKSSKKTKEDNVETVQSGANRIKTMQNRRAKVERNVAIASLLAGYGNILHSKETEDKVKLQTPSDLDRHSPNKTIMKNKTAVKNKLPPIAPVTMFKKKTKVPSNVDVLSNSSTTPNDVVPSKSIEEKVTNEYVPSVYANELFLSYMEKSKLQEMKKKDLWIDAEKKMKEIESNRKTKQCILIDFLEESPQPTVEANGMDTVTLPQHRHLLNEECVVCDVLCDKKDSKMKTNGH